MRTPTVGPGAAGTGTGRLSSRGAEGRGVAMTIGPFATDEIAAGRLVQPFQLLLPHRHQWQFACAAEHRMKPKIRRFEDWLVKQINADPILERYREKGKKND